MVSTVNQWLRRRFLEGFVTNPTETIRVRWQVQEKLIVGLKGHTQNPSKWMN